VFPPADRRAADREGRGAEDDVGREKGHGSDNEPLYAPASPFAGAGLRSADTPSPPGPCCM